MLCGEGEAYAEFYRLDLFAPELFGGEDADGAFAFRGVVGGRDGDVDPDGAREVADLGRWLDGEGGDIGRFDEMEEWKSGKRTWEIMVAKSFRPS